MKILRFPDLKAKGIDWSRVHVDRLEKAGQFPKRFNIGTNTVAWSEEEVDAWLRERINARRRTKQIITRPAAETTEAERTEQTEQTTEAA